jgi:hypothetical protein
MQHMVGGLVDLREHAIEDLPQTLKLQDLFCLRVPSIDTTDTDNKQ